jgi:hypothetical protein
MAHVIVPSFAAWESFYVIVGSSAAALTGLQFVVIVLGAETKRISGTAARAFATPTVVHFCAALLVSAILSAPWQTVASPAVCLAGSALAGLAYIAGVMRDMRRQNDYVPVIEDWLWHVALPAVAYVAALAGAITLPLRTANSLFVIGASTVFLLFIGIHNAWDSVIYLALNRSDSPASEKPAPPPPVSEPKP